MNLSIVIVSYKSDHLMEKLISSCPDYFEIIVIENSLNKDLKFKLENKFKNVHVYIPKENLGYGSAINFGIKQSKNNFVFCMAPDVEINKNCYDGILKVIKSFKNFSILAPTYIDESIHKNYTIPQNPKNKNINIENYNLIEVSEIDGAAFIINKSNVENNKIMDENIFLYFESSDMCMNLVKQGKKLFVIENLKFNHFGTQSSHPDLKNHIKVNRAWHFCWSKFYLWRKHRGYLFGIRKTMPNFIRAIKMCLFYAFKKDKENLKIHRAELSGLLSSYFFRKSYFRPMHTKEKN